MAQKTCTPLPLMDIPRFRNRMSRREKVRRSESIIDATPKLLRRQLVQSIQKSGDMNHLLNESRVMQREVCSHAALATFLDESLRIKYGIALYKTDEKHHDLILSTLSNQSCSQEELSDFLVEVEFEGIESAVVQMLERVDVQVFPRPDKPVANKHEGSSFLSAYLLEVASKSKVARNRLLATKWLPYYTDSVNSCIAMLEQLLHHHDADVRGMAGLHISHVKPDYPNIEVLLWRPIEHETWCGKEFVSVNGVKGGLQKLLLKRLVELACERGEEKDSRQKLSNGWAQFWFQQMTLTARADRRSFEEAVSKFYSSIHMSAPKAVLWFDSPRAASVAAASYLHTVHPGIDSRKFANVSKPHRYISNLIDKIERFPDFTQHCLKDWDFGRKNWHPRAEYVDERYLPRCGCHLSGMLPERDRHIWDVISEFNYHLTDEQKSLADVLRSNSMQGIDVLEADAANLLGTETADCSDSSSPRYFMSCLMDQARLGMVGYRSVLRQIGACPHIYDGLEQLLQICPTFVAFDDVVIASERPIKIRRDSQNRLHSLDDAPSIEYADGWGVYSIHGMTVSPKIILAPESLTIDEIINQYNLEIRRVMLERYGIEKFITNSGAELLNEDECGMLYRMPMKNDPFNMVRVLNRTPQADGTFRTYFIAVPPNTTTAREAVAWSFQMESENYRPTIET
ncbi:MAG: hypothetical protein HYX67_07915 [Candidatus Melainabacteria bacterium]|nr:hypothetical protein [Candidatus Melainabacteria bacterium]